MSLIVSIEKRYKNFNLNIDFDSAEKSLGVLGASGCGKSLTLKCIAGIETPDKGRIILNDRILYDSSEGINLPAQQRRIGLLFQNYALFPNMTVRKNIEIGIRDKSSRKKQIDLYVSMLRLEGMLDRYPHQLSGGEQQRVALARIMAYEPEVLLFDEPFSALDSFLKDQLQQELLDALREYQGDILMVSHSRDELYRFCQSIAVMKQGHIIEHGNKDEIFGSPTEITTAKLTGCKNISRARKHSDYVVEALDWKLCLQTEQRVKEEVCFVGIRAHNIRPSTGKEENSVPITLEGYSEGPFENRIILRSNSDISEEVRLSWIVAKQEGKKILCEQLPSHIALPKEHLLLLTDNSSHKNQL